jgi:hypothetical protein
VLSPDQLARKADPFNAFSSSLGPGTYTWREAQNWHSGRPKVNGAPDWSMLNPTTVHLDRFYLSLHARPLPGGPHGMGGGAHIWGEAPTLGSQLGAESVWGHATRSVLSPTAVDWHR